MGHVYGMNPIGTEESEAAEAYQFDEARPELVELLEVHLFELLAHCGQRREVARRDALRERNSQTEQGIRLCNLPI